MTLPGYILITALSFTQTDTLSSDKYELLDVLDVKSSVRALEIDGDSTIAFAGSGGLLGVSLDAGQTWDTTRITYNDEVLNFRSCAIIDGSVIFATIESPGIIFKSSLRNLRDAKVKYFNDHEGMFLDAIAVSDDGLAVCMGDPVDDCFTILISEDSGEHWARVPCSNLPELINGEAAFAASNGNISISGNQIRIATGGVSSRVFRSDDRGKTWKVSSTPLLQGSQMTGAFAVAFTPDNSGILVGGNWQDKQNNNGNIATSIDAGVTWKLTAEGTGPGYRSAVTIHPTNPNIYVITGTEGLDISYDRGATWLPITSSSLYTARYNSTGTAIWLAGNGKITKLTLNEDTH